MFNINLLKDFKLISTISAPFTDSGDIKDQFDSSIKWTRQGKVPNVYSNGIESLRMDNANGWGLETKKRILFPQNYTVFYYLKWRSSDSGWRTLHRNTNDHNVIVGDRSRNLGFYSNRNGGFRDSG